ncbi:MAG: HIT family protein [Candidatus Woesearchaeota archaeon]|nr:HIT family protein [Candidatus Woesearchaeota archaeon]
MNCDQCKILDLPSKPFIYEDDKVFAVLASPTATPGHVVVMPKAHFPILENVPDEMAAHLYVVANKISMALFDALHAQGTNVLICNGVPAGQESAHCMVHVIPRMSNDELSFVWLPRQLTEEQMATVELQLKEECAKITGTPREQAIDALKEVGEAEEAKETKEEMKKTEEKEAPPEDYEDYQIKHITRIP